MRSGVYTIIVKQKAKKPKPGYHSLCVCSHPKLCVWYTLTIKKRHVGACCHITEPCAFPSKPRSFLRRNRDIVNVCGTFYRRTYIVELSALSTATQMFGSGFAICSMLSNCSQSPCTGPESSMSVGILLPFCVRSWLVRPSAIARRLRRREEPIVGVWPLEEVTFDAE